MKQATTIFFVFMCLIGASAQKSYKLSKTVREIRKINRIKDPEKAIADIESLIPNIPQGNARIRNFRIYLTLRQADLYMRTGDFQNAETLLTALVKETDELGEIKWFKAMLPFLEGTIFDSYDHLGYYYLTTGNLKKAEEFFLISKDKRESVFPKRSVHRILPQVGLGSLYYRRNEFDETYRIFNQVEHSLRKATSTFYDYDNVSRLYLNDLAEICLRQGRGVEAWNYINELSLASSGIAKFGNRIGSRLEIARIFELKARYFLLEKDYSKAQEYLNRANKYYSDKITTSDVKFKLLKTQALVYWSQGDLEKSDQAFLTLVNAYRDHINQNFISMSEYEKEQFYNTLKSDFNLFNAYALQQLDSKSSTLIEAMLNNAINTKAILLNESNKIKNSILNRGDVALIGKLRQWEGAKATLSAYYFDKDAIQKIDSLEARVETLEKEINSQSQLFTSRDNPKDWQQVKSSLNRDEAAVEIIRINTVERSSGKIGSLGDSAVYLAIVIKPDKTAPEVVVFANGNQMEGRHLSYYRNSIMARTADNASYITFWLPIIHELAGVRRVYLSPDGAFNQLNLNTLKNPVSGKYLIDEQELIYVTNTGDLLSKSDPVASSAKAVLVGRPSYDLTVIPTSKIDNKVYGTRFVMTDELASFKEQEFSDLPATEDEVDRIEETLTARNIAVQVFKGESALEGNVKAVNNPMILHVATHGFFVDDVASSVNPMIRSGLVLAGVKNQGQMENSDGILTAYEATNLNLDKTSLVVLSACETGLGEVRNGEGVYGLQRAIIVAGASNLLMSLWKVDDEATALLMTTLYNAWQPDKNQEAFRNAQLAMRQQYPDPFYWGAFIMLGK
ncbi:MAG TPA: CHAT domain-containing protein [Cyclobacteriaceae bacterium]